MVIYRKYSPPRIKPPTPTSPERPPTAARPYSSNRLHTSPHRFPVPSVTVFWSWLRLVELRRLRSINTVFDAGKIDIPLVTITAHCKLGSQRGDDFETKGDIRGRVGFEERCRVESTGFKAKTFSMCRYHPYCSSTYIGRSTSAV